MPKFETKPEIGMMDNVTAEAVAKQFAKEFLKNPEAMKEFRDLYKYVKGMDDKNTMAAASDQMYATVSEWVKKNFNFAKGLSAEQLDNFKDLVVSTAVSYISAYENVKSRYDKLPEHLSGMFLRNYLEKEARKEIGANESLVSAVASQIRDEIKPQADKFLAQEKQRQEKEMQRKAWTINNFKFIHGHHSEYDHVNIKVKRGDGTVASGVISIKPKASEEEISAAVNKKFEGAKVKTKTDGLVKGIEITPEQLRWMAEQIIRQREQYALGS